MRETPLTLVTPHSLKRQRLVLWLAFLVILLVSALAFYSTQRLIALTTRVEQTQNILLETSRFLSHLKDVENGGRSYFVTGDARYLQTQRSGIANVDLTAARLRELQDGPEVKRRLDRLFGLAARRIEFSRQLVARRPIVSEARQSVFRGTAVMDLARREADAIVRSQTHAYRLESERLERQALLTSLALVVGVVLCLGLIGWLFSKRGRELERRQQLEEELRALNVELEMRVAERTAQLLESEARAALVIAAALDAVISIDQSGAITGWNPQAENIFGRTREEVLGRPVDEMIMPERYRQAHRAGLGRYIATGEAHVLNRRIELVALRRNGEEFPVELSITPIGEGDALSFSAFIRDVTERRAHEEQLRQLQRIDAIGRLTGGVAHDFNNLLAIIHGNSELIRAELQDGTEMAEMADDVVSAASRGGELVRRLLAFARMQHLEPEPIDLNARLPDIMALLERSLGEKVNVRVKTARKLWHAIVDPTQVDDALVNLAINARDAMPNGGTLTIETRNVSLEEDYAAHHVEVAPGDYVMLAVSDTGTGMSPEVIARAFEPFFTTKEEGKGTGLGLSQVFGWVKQSGGHIKIYSELGHGTTIKLYLPRASSHGGEKAAEPEAATLKGDETIFVVEDNPNVRRTVVRQLHDLGYKTVEAESGPDAIRRLRDGVEFDLLLTDIVMPGGMTGYQLADQLRSERPGIRVLFTSGYTELAAASGLATSREALLSKPYRKQDLGRAVRSVLDETQMAKAN